MSSDTDLKEGSSSPPHLPTDPGKRGINGLTSSAAGALLTLVLLVLIPYLVPGLQRLQLLKPIPDGEQLVAFAPPAPSASVGETVLVIETKEQTELQQPENVAVPPLAAEIVSSKDKPPRAIEDPSGVALSSFFRVLGAVERSEPHAVARISYFGDSIVASDFITATLRRAFQRRFGDAGHGFMLMANAWPGYFHNDVTRFATAGWQLSRVVGPFAPDGLYGFGGVSFRSQGAGVFSRFGTAKTGRFGGSVSRFTIDYLEYPEGGMMQISIDGVMRDEVDTRASVAKTALKTYEVEDGPHELEVRALGPGLRTFGVWMERDGPGVVLDAIGIQGCRIRFLDKNDDAHFAEQLRARNPALLMFQYGMNESEDGELFPLDQYESTMKAVLNQVKTALADASCLLVGPMDRADKKGSVFHSRPVIPKLAAIQRKVAFDVGCAYWDTFQAMGGLGSMGTWVQRGLGSTDLAHPTSAGADILGQWIYHALMESYEVWKAANRQ